MFIRAIFLLALCACVAVATFDERFSSNSCIVIGQPESSSACENHLMRITNESSSTSSDDTQIFFTRFEDAVAKCPFSPILIEIAETVHVHNPVSFDRPDHYIIQGHTSFLNHRAALVGLSNIDVARDVQSITLFDLELNGCDTALPLFTAGDEDCLADHSVFVLGSIIHHYTTAKVICLVGGEFFITSSTLAYTPHHAIWLSATKSINVLDNQFLNCGNSDEACVYFTNLEHNPTFHNNVLDVSD